MAKHEVDGRAVPEPPAARRSCDRPWDIAIIGAGFILQQLTVEALTDLSYATIVFYSRVTRGMVHALRELNPAAQLVDIDDGSYVIGAYRPTVYQEMAKRVIDSVLDSSNLTRNARAVLLEPGSALVADSVTREVLDEARRRGLLVKLVPGISCIEMVLKEMEVDPLEGLQIVQAQKLLLKRQGVNPNIPLIIIQPAYFDTLWWAGSPYSRSRRSALLTERLKGLYPLAHRAAAIRFAMDLGQSANVFWFRIGDLDEVFPLLSPLHTLFIPGIAEPDVDTGFASRIESWDALLENIETNDNGDIVQKPASDSVIELDALPLSLRTQNETLKREWTDRCDNLNGRRFVVLKKAVTLEVRMPELIRHIKMSGAFLSAVREIAERRLALDAAHKEEITVSDEEIQDGADDLRILRGLQKRSNFEAWLDSNRLSIADFEAYVRESVTIAKFKQHLLSIADREKYANLNKWVTALYEEHAYSDWLQVKTNGISTHLPKGDANAD